MNCQRGWAPPRLLDIDELLAEPLRRSGVPVEVELQDGLDFDEADVLAVYRIAQEALTNVAGTLPPGTPGSR